MTRHLGIQSKLRMYTQRPHIQNKAAGGFTIVELLIVVIVIAILATIAIVGFAGVSATAKESALKADLRSGATQIGVAKEETGSYPGSDAGLKKSNETVFAYTSGGTTFCLQASREDLVGKSFYITQDGSLQQGECPAAPLATMQSFTTAQCAALPVFDGSNASAIRTLADTRGGATQNYEVAKLADNKCWMLTNLKLGSTSGPITLTPADSNVVSNFTLPQVGTTGSTSTGTEAGNGTDTPYAYGPVPGDTGSGTTNYGYLYNWSAANAGATRTTNPAGNIAANSICPSGWRLPSSGANGEFAMLNAKMNNPAATVPSANSGSGFYQNWNYTGPFKGVFSGSWYGSFYDQGTWSYARASSANVTFADSAYSAIFRAAYVNPAAGTNRSYGYSVRCLLN